jgi:hypothetical protein
MRIRPMRPRPGVVGPSAEGDAGLPGDALQRPHHRAEDGDPLPPPRLFRAAVGITGTHGPEVPGAGRVARMVRIQSSTWRPNSAGSAKAAT